MFSASTAAPILSHLQTLLSYREDQIQLAEAALWVAKNEYPQLDIAYYLDYLDRLAERVLLRLPQDRANLVHALNHVLFEEEGFVSVNPKQHDARASFLNQVLERKEGLAITLSIIYLEVGWRVGLPLEGVPFPDYFLIKMPVGEKDLVVLDPAGGFALSTEMLMERLRQTSAHSRPLSYVLSTAGRRDILLHMLDSLRQSYIHHRQWGKLLQVYDALLIAKPGLDNIWLERAEVCYKLECFHWALESYRHYFVHSADADEQPQLQARIDELDQRLRHLH
jgi:regulator of sirC expression with transglutaminase-like and TPR domain